MKRGLGIAWLWAVLVPALVWANSGAGSVAVRTNRWSPITSHSRLFIVTDMPPRDALEIAIWAESVRDLLSAWTGHTAVRSDGFPIVISAELPADNHERGYVVKSQGLNADGYLRQGLAMVNPAAIDQEDVLESLCSLLLERWLFGHHPPPPGDDFVARIPDWLAVGVARNLYPELRHQDLRALDSDAGSGSGWLAARLFEQRVMPAGRWPEKAWAGVVVAWLADVAGAPALMDQVASGLSKEASISADDLFAIAQVANIREFNMAWDVWRAEQSRRFIPGHWSTDTGPLEEIIALRPEHLGLVYPGPLMDGRLSFETLIDARDAMWAQQVARRVAFSLSATIPGQSPELAEITGAFVKLFEDTGKAPGTRDRASAAELNARWLAGLRAVNDFKSQRDARSEMVSAAAMSVTGADTNDAMALEYLLDWWNHRLERHRTNTHDRATP